MAQDQTTPFHHPKKEHALTLDLARETAALHRLSLGELRQRFADLFGEPTRTGNRIWLIKRLAWRLQALHEGDLSERARQRIAALANDADLRLTPPRSPRPAGIKPARRCDGAVRPLDPRLPLAGTILTRRYKGATLRVQVLAQGFEFEDTVYASLSAVAKAITGSHCNGYLFFRLPSQSGDQP
jgi:hypothetical protein